MLSVNDNTTLSGLTLKFGLLAVAAIGVQSFPVSAVLTMPLLGFYWLGAIVHLYMVSIAYGVFTDQLPRSAIVIPAAFYGLGLSAGVYSDVMARRYNQDQFAEVKRTIPKDVRYVAFSPFNKLRTYNPLGGELRPENAGFSFAALRFPSTFDHSNNYEWLPVTVKDKVLCDEARSHPAYRYGADIHRIGDRCYVAVSIPAPDKFLRIGGPMHSIETQTISPPPLEYPWGKVFLEETNIVLHDNGRQEVVGKLRGALVRKLPYFFLPAFSCTGLFAQARNKCGGTWFMTSRVHRTGFFPSVNGSSDGTAPLLMDALIKLRG